MDLLWNIIIVFGLVSLVFLIVGIWTHLDMLKRERQKKKDAERGQDANHGSDDG